MACTWTPLPVYTEHMLQAQVRVPTDLHPPCVLIRDVSETALEKQTQPGQSEGLRCVVLGSGMP